MHTQLAQTLQLPWFKDPTSGVDTTTKVTGPLSKFPEDPKLGDIVSGVLPYIFTFAGIGLFLMILFAGFNFLPSAGAAKKLEQGKQQLTNAILGFVIIFASFWLVQIFGVMFGLKSMTDMFK